MPDLKPCPFCGCRAVIQYIPMAKIYYASCEVCGASGPHKQEYPDAVDSWNRRYTDTNKGRVVDAGSMSKLSDA